MGCARIQRLSIVYPTISAASGYWLRRAIAGSENDDDDRGVPGEARADDAYFDPVARGAEDIPAATERVRGKRNCSGRI
jgi:hypothetical protein